jgi:microcystin-dependent protein
MPYMIDSSAPLGEIKTFGGGTIPQGFLLCNGASYSAAIYPGLAATLWNGSSYNYGGSGAFPTGNFNVPDLRDKFPKGRNADALGATGGSNTLVDHTHSGSMTGSISHSHAGSAVGGTIGGSDGQHVHDVERNVGAVGSLAYPFILSATATTTEVSAGGVRMTGSGHSHGFNLSAGGQSFSGNTTVSGSVGSGNAPASTDSRPAYQSVNFIIRAF